MEKIAESQDRQNLENVCALFVLCILVTTLQLCYMRMHSFSANLMHIIFFMYIIDYTQIDIFLYSHHLSG